jgi:3-hydroxy-9,10-secoandrosta-1,3,5(10)-triene-9,17-dione monooxygenase
VTETLDRETTAPAGEELIRRAESLVPLLRANAERAEQLRRLTDDTVRAVEDAGLFRMLQPVRHGGYGTKPATVAKVMTLIASGCPSTAWVMQIYSGIARLAEVLPDEALAEVYASEQPKIAGTFGRAGAVADPVEGGFRIRGGGTWPFNSGCHHADWDLLRLEIVETDGSRTDAFAIVPLSDLTISDDWNVMGASATGSNSVECGDIFIPEHRVSRATMQAFASLRGGELAGAFTVMMPLGMARYALDAFLELARSRGITMLGYGRMIDAPAVQIAVATARVNIALIEAFQHWVLSSLEPGAEPIADEMLPGAGSAGCYRLARQAIEGLYELCPTDGIRLAMPLQRLLRDLHSFTHQGAMAPYVNYERYGRHLCGVDAGPSAFEAPVRKPGT